MCRLAGPALVSRARKLHRRIKRQDVVSRITKRWVIFLAHHPGSLLCFDVPEPGPLHPMVPPSQASCSPAPGRGQVNHAEHLDGPDGEGADIPLCMFLWPELRSMTTAVFRECSECGLAVCPKRWKTIETEPENKGEKERIEAPEAENA